jgi:REP element-mobilizing transposase RayT
MSKKGFAIHLVLVPEYEIMDYHAPIIEKKLYQITDRYNIDLIEISIMKDHIHLLITMPNGDDKINFSILNRKAFESFLLEFNDSVADSIENIFGDKFKWKNGVHVMILPASHIKILSSYIRDQENVHSVMSLEEELGEIFEKNMDDSGDDSDDEQPNPEMYG